MTQNKPKILIIYKSSTGFTKKYAGLLAEKLDCRAINFKNIRSVSLSSYDMLIFGTRAHAGSASLLFSCRVVFILIFNMRWVKIIPEG